MLRYKYFTIYFHITTVRTLVHASNIEVTGGTFKIGDNFSVASDGTLTAVNGHFSGAITGGTINIGNAFVVTRDGAVHINSGELNLGAVSINDSYADLGAFRISNQYYGVLYSTNGEIELVTTGPIEDNPMLVIKKNGISTTVGFGAIGTGDIDLTALSDEYGSQWSSVARNIIELWKRVESL